MDRATAGTLSAWTSGCLFGCLSAPARSVGLVAAACTWLAAPASAQVATEIVRDGTIGPVASVQPEVSLRPEGGRTVSIPERLGERPGGGPNIFHSFGVFHLGAGDRAVFSADPNTPTDRIFSRITGGDPSRIFGTLVSVVPGADLYLLNPAGIVFGPGAQLDVDGSVIASTAHRLEFAGGEVFATDGSAAPTLLERPDVAAFGFLERPASILALRASLAVPDQSSLLLLGGEVQLQLSTLRAPSGAIEIASVDGPGRLSLVDGGAPRLLDVVAASRADVTLLRTTLDLEGPAGAGGGDLRILGGRVAFADSDASVSARGGGSAGRIDLDAISLDLGGGSTLLAQGLDSSSDGGEIAIVTDGLFARGGAGFSVDGRNTSAGRIDVRADRTQIEGSTVSATGFDTADAGSVSISTRELILSLGGTIEADALGAGNAGRVSITGEALRLGSSTVSATSSGMGDGGETRVLAGSLELVRSDLRADALGGGDAGRVQVDVRDGLSLELGSQLRAVALGPGAAGGEVEVTADELRIDTASSLGAGSLGGAGGRIGVRARDVQIFDRSSVSTSARGSSGGAIDVSSDTLVVGRGARITSQGQQGGDGGSLAIDARSVRIEDGASLSVSGDAGGSGGEVTVRAAELRITAPRDVAAEDGSGIDVTSIGGSSAGTARIDVGTLELDGRAAIFAVGFAGATGGDVRIDADRVAVRRGAQINTGSGTTAGSIQIDARERVEVSNVGGGPFDVVQALDSAQGLADVAFSGIFATSAGPNGKGGAISIRAPEVVLGDGGFLASITVGGADAGDVRIEGDRIAIRHGAGIDTGTAGAGRGGNVSLTARERIDLSGRNASDQPDFAARIRSVTTGPSAAGDIVLRAPLIEIDGGALSGSTLEPTRFDTAGPAGTVQVEADRLRLAGGGVIDSSSFSGALGGRIVIRARDALEITGAGSGISARAVSSGAGGAIDVSTGTLTLSSGGAIVTDSEGNFEDQFVFLRDIVPSGRFQLPMGDPTGAAGSIRVDAERVLLAGASRISTAARLGAPPGARADGNIDIDARTSLELSGASEITASVVDGRGGDVAISTPGVVLLREGSRVVAEARGDDSASFRQGGRIDIGAGLLLRESGTRVSADAGQGIDGLVSLNAPEVELDNDLVRLPAGFLDTAALFKPRCAVAAQRGDTSSFVVAAGQPLPPSPEGLLVAFDLDPEPGLARTSNATPPTLDRAGDSDLRDVAASVPPRRGAPQADAADAEGSLAFRGGRFEEAEEQWDRAGAGYAEAGDETKVADALRKRAQAQLALGDYASSVAGLLRAVEIAEASGDDLRLARALGSLGNAFIGLEQPEVAERYLQRGIETARAVGAPEIESTLLNNLGNARAARGDHPAALGFYERSAALASGLGVVRARSNASRAALALGDAETAARLARSALRTLPALDGEPTPDRVDVTIHLGVTLGALASARSDPTQGFLARAGEILSTAGNAAEQLGDARRAAYALGNLAGLYERENRFDEARVLTRRALANAERAGAEESLYRWHWQLGRLLWAEGRAGDALDAYRRAARLLGETRVELRYRYGNPQRVFESAVGPVYRDLVQALLESASLVASERDAEALLLEARDTVEALKAAELRDYFRDECLADLAARSKPLDDVSPTAAIVYPISLPDRLEILVTVGGDVRRYTAPVGARELEAEARRFRELLEEYTTSRYLVPSWKLFDWLVAPYIEDLRGANVDTIAFVPGGAVRTIPLAALHDRQQFLIQRFSVAVTPSLALTDPRALDLSGRRLLLAGLSRPAHGFEALPNVPSELRSIAELYGGTVLLDESFTSESFGARLADTEVAAVHLASHARFTGDTASSFLLAYDGPVSIEELGQYVGVTRFRPQPLELLVMSACETAAGDDRAALGLAGVAIQSGARSAVGSLWQINDQTATKLMGTFYRALGEDGVTKAQALRRAQIELVDLGAHPYLWSPFLVISNWL